MNVKFEAVMRTKNRFVIPKETRDSLGMNAGDVVVLSIDENKFSVPLPNDRGRVKVPVSVSNKIDLCYGDTINCEITTVMEWHDFMSYVDMHTSRWTK